MKSTFRALIALTTLALGALLPAMAGATEVVVEITNITRSQIISPPVVVSHSFAARLFTPGAPASDGLAMLAEDGMTGALVSELELSPAVLDVQVGTGMIMPGESMSFVVDVNGAHPLISAVGMLVTSNDAFFGLDSFDVLGGRRWLQTTTSPAFDAGSEANTESCESIPGPPCGNPGVRVLDGAEGYVHTHPGILGGGDLDPTMWSWQNPVVSIRLARR